MHTPLTRFLTRQRFKTIQPYIRGSVLDLGCGAAEITEWLPAGMEYLGVDSHPPFIQWLEDHRPGFKFVQADINTGDTDFGKRFDTILMLAVLEHLSNPDNAFALAQGHLTEAGSLILTTPTSLGLAIHALLARLGLVSSYAAEEHEQSYTRSDLRDLAARNSLRITQYRTFLWGGNQLCVCRPA